MLLSGPWTERTDEIPQGRSITTSSGSRPEGFRSRYRDLSRRPAPVNRTPGKARNARGLRQVGANVFLLALVAFALRATGSLAADPQPYAVTLGPTGESLLDEALNDSSTLISLRETAPVGPFALLARARQDAERFVTALRSFGYYKGSAHIEIAGRPVDDPGLLDRLERMRPDPPAPIVIKIERGPLFHLGKIDLMGSIPDDVKHAFPLRTGVPAIAQSVLDARAQYEEQLKKDGYALAKVGEPVGILREEDHLIDLSFRVDTGPRVALGTVTVRGAERVDPGFVQRRLSVATGERFDPDRIEQSRKDLLSLGVFSSVRARPGEELDANGRLPIDFDLTERERRVVGINAAFSTDIGGSLALSWRHRNLFGSAEQLTLTGGVTQLGGNSTIGIGYNAAVSLLKPDFLLREQSLQADLAAFKQHFDAYDQQAYTSGVVVNRRWSDFWKGSLGLAAEQETITQQGVTNNYTLISLPATIKYDDTNSLLDPSRGIRANLSLTPFEPVVGRRSTPFLLSQLFGSTYWDFGTEGLSILAWRGLIGYAAGAGQFDLPADKRFYAGGSTTVRGYRFQSVGPRFPDGRPQGGTAITASSLEFRQRFLEDYGAVVFVDAGQVTANGPPFAGKWGIGAGIGARYYTALGPVRVDIAVPVTRSVGSGSFELYIGLGQAF